MRKHPKLFTIIFLSIGLLFHIISTCIAFRVVIINGITDVDRYLYLYGISTDAAFVSTLFYLFGYLLMRYEKEYYTNKFSTLYVITFPLAAYLMLILLPRIDYYSLFAYTYLIASILFMIIVVLYFCINKPYNPLIKDISLVDKKVRATTIMNATLAIIYAITLVINYIFIEYDVVMVYIAIAIYTIFITSLIIFIITLIVDIYLSKEEDKNGTVN